MMTSTAQNIRKSVNMEIAYLRSDGLFDGFLSMNGAIAMRPSATPGIVTPATIGWNIVRSSWRPRKYQGAFDGFGVWLMSARPSNGAFTSAEKIVTIAVSDSSDANSMDNRCGQVWTLSWASPLVCWIEPALTTVSNRWVWPPGPTPAGAPADIAGALARVAVAVAVPPPPADAPSSPPPASAALRL